jgi:hypothetical protein
MAGINKNETTFYCDNPKCSGREDWNAAKSHVPPGWKMIRVLGRMGTYCPDCVPHFYNGTGDHGPDNISRDMKQDLGMKD